MMRVVLVAVVVLAATQTAVAAPVRQSTIDVTELLSGTALMFPETDQSARVPSRAEAFDLNAEMQTFVEPLLAVRDSSQKLVALLKAMDDRGLFSMDYAETTRTVGATFGERQGNCLSFTMLFVGLARAAGLAAAYQSVEVPPTWTNDGQVVIANHVNAIVRTSFGEDTVVDFNIRDFQGQQRRHRVSDDYALGLFYTNRGAEALLAEQHRASFEYFRAAALTYPEMAGVWVNLGVLYARQGLYEHAEAAYLQALEADSGEQSALANLALVYQALGEHELEESYQKRVQSYRERNPYYHYALAERAVAELRWPDALAELRKALHLKYDEAQFHALRGRAFEATNRQRDAERSYAEAREYAAAEQERQRERVLFDSLAVR
jgi:tetratricopeptide (TPR) repeat protein